MPHDVARLSFYDFAVVANFKLGLFFLQVASRFLVDSCVGKMTYRLPTDRDLLNLLTAAEDLHLRHELASYIPEALAESKSSRSVVHVNSELSDMQLPYHGPITSPGRASALYTYCTSLSCSLLGISIMPFHASANSL